MVTTSTKNNTTDENESQEKTFIRESRVLDEEYMETVEAGDTETQERLVKQAAEQNGDFHVVRFIVNRFNNSVEDVDVLYAINTKKRTSRIAAEVRCKGNSPY